MCVHVCACACVHACIYVYVHIIMCAQSWMLLAFFAALLHCPIVRPRTTSHERTVVKAVHKTVPSKPPRSVKSQVGRVPAFDHVGGATQDEVGLGTELDNIAGLLSAPDRDIHSQTHLSDIESGTVPSFPLYVYTADTHCTCVAALRVTCFVFLLMLGLCSSDHPDVFATSSLHVSQGKPLHDDIVPEVAEELGPGRHCMATYHCVLIHLQQTYVHKQICTCLPHYTYVHPHVSLVWILYIYLYPHTHASNHTCTFAFISCLVQSH